MKIIRTINGKETDVTREVLDEMKTRLKAGGINVGPTYTWSPKLNKIIRK
tara:strand:+ start:232 stop:381 length:150 start_codon:yes stop_codon:yes gene_type:complete